MVHREPTGIPRSALADGAPATASTLASPTSVVVLPDGRIAFAERNAHKIRVIGSDGILRTLAGTGTPGSAADGARFRSRA